MRTDLSGHKFTFPRQCACCGAMPETTLTASASRSKGKRVVHTTTKSWDFPYCTKCVLHVNAARLAVSVTVLIVIASFILAVYLWSSSDESLFGTLTAILGAGVSIGVYQNLMARAKAMCTPSCVCCKVSVGYLGWQGSCHMFEVTSSKFAVAFMVANQSKLVNVRPETWRWLESNGLGSSKDQPQSAKRHMT